MTSILIKVVDSLAAIHIALFPDVLDKNPIVSIIDHALWSAHNALTIK